MMARTRRELLKLSGVAVLSTLSVMLAVLPAPGQIPDSFTNLQVLPKDIAKRELVDTMRGFTAALGVRCPFCHVGEEGKPLSTFDFAADTKDTKQNARLMLRMAQSINNENLAKLVNRPAHAVQVQCVTCHHGFNRPRSLEDVLYEEITVKDIDAGVAKYNELRKKYYGGFTFDFRDGSLNNLAQQLLTANKHDAALAILQLNTQNYPDSPIAYFLLGETYVAKGDKAKAVENYQKSLALAPDNPMAKRKLEELTK